MIEPNRPLKIVDPCENAFFRRLLYNNFNLLVLSHEELDGGAYGCDIAVTNDAFFTYEDIVEKKKFVFRETCNARWIESVKTEDIDVVKKNFFYVRCLEPAIYYIKYGQLSGETYCSFHRPRVRWL